MTTNVTPIREEFETLHHLVRQATPLFKQANKADVEGLISTIENKTDRLRGRMFDESEAEEDRVLTHNTVQTILTAYRGREDMPSRWATYLAAFASSLGPETFALTLYRLQEDYVARGLQGNFIGAARIAGKFYEEFYKEFDVSKMIDCRL